jgi:dipeptidyl aminopeptidase/acylaminoacyl peptidase
MAENASSSNAPNTPITPLATLIPREVLFGNPKKASPQISPDGKHLAYLAPDDRNVLQVWLRSVAGGDDRVLTHDKKRGIRAYFWAFDGEQLIYAQDYDGDENFHLFAVNIATNQIRDLTPFEGVKAEMIALSYRLPHQALVGLNLRDRTLFDVYRLDLRTGAIVPEAQNPGAVVDWKADLRLQVRAAVAATDDAGSDLLIRNRPADEWRVARHWGPDDEGSPLFFSADGKKLYLQANHDANAARLIALDLATLQETVIAGEEQYDVDRVLAHPTRRTLQAVAFYRERLSWQPIGRTMAGHFKALAQVRPGDIMVTGRDLADAHWMVAYVTDDGPVYYYLYETATRTASFLFTNQPQLEGLPLARMEPVSVPARDGLTIHGYLTLPVGREPRGLPAVLVVHGGPWARDVWGFAASAQWLANRGYAVLQMNYRGSTGYGKSFLNAGNREWGGKMHLDLIDGVNWLVDKGIADPRRVAVYGGSYGGYAALAGLAFTPEVFACGVDIVGPSNILTLLKTVPPYWKPMLRMFSHRVGDPQKDEAFLQSRSPLFSAGRICRPLLIGQGANDPRVKQSESDQIVQAMRGSKLPVEYVVYEDEGHGFARPENRMHFMAVAEQFLAKYLGGAAEPMGELKGHSGVVK